MLATFTHGFIPPRWAQFFPGTSRFGAFYSRRKCSKAARPASVFFTPRICACALISCEGVSQRTLIASIELLELKSGIHFNDHGFALVQSCAQTGDWRLALRALYAIEISGIPATHAVSSRVLALLASAGRVNETRDLLSYLWNSSSFSGESLRDRQPTARMVVSAANAAVEVGRVDVAAAMIRTMERNGIAANAYAICVLVKGFGRERRPDSITSLLDSLSRRKIEPDLVLYNAAIDAYVRCGRCAQARRLIRSAERAGLKLDSRSYNPLLRAVARAGNIDEAFAICAEMQKRGVRPSSVTLNALIHACVAGKQWDRARELLAKALAGSRSRYALSWTRDMGVAYTTVISGLARDGNIDEATSLFAEMVLHMKSAGQIAEREQQLNVPLAAILTALLDQGTTSEAWMFFRSIQRDMRLRLSPDMYNAVIRGLARKGDCKSVDAAARLLEEMISVFVTWKDSGGRLSRISSNHERECCEGPETMHLGTENLVSSAGVLEMKHVLPGKRPRARGSWTFDRKRGSRAALPHEIVVGHNSVMDGYVRSGRTALAEKLLIAMRENGIVPSTVTYTTIMNGYGRELDLPSAQRMFSEMKRDGLAADVVAMNAFIGACVRVGHMEMATRVFEEMRRVGGRLSPNLTTYSALIAGYLRGDDVNRAWDIYDQMKGLGIAPNERLLNRMMAACVARATPASGFQDCGNPSSEKRSSFRRTAPAQRWASSRALTLIRDMDICKCSAQTKLRWRRALQSFET